MFEICSCRESGIAATSLSVQKRCRARHTLEYNGTFPRFLARIVSSVFFRDLLVASVAAGLGLSMIQVALLNRGWWFENFIIKHIESSRGRNAARRALGFGGTAMIVIGAWTLCSPWIKNAVSDAKSPARRAVDFENLHFSGQAMSRLN